MYRPESLPAAAQILTSQIEEQMKLIKKHKLKSQRKTYVFFGLKNVFA